MTVQMKNSSVSKKLKNERAFFQVCLRGLNNSSYLSKDSDKEVVTMDFY